MYVLNLWHTVADYAAWKRAFDGDPLGREASGVRRYAITRPVDDPQTVVGELRFETLGEAEAFAGRLRELWAGPAGELVSNAGLRITELVEERELGGEAGRRAA